MNEINYRILILYTWLNKRKMQLLRFFRSKINYHFIFLDYLTWMTITKSFLNFYSGFVIRLFFKKAKYALVKQLQYYSIR